MRLVAACLPRGPNLPSQGRQGRIRVPVPSVQGLSSPISFLSCADATRTVQPDYKKYVKGITSSLPPRPGTQSGTAKRWAFWLLFALVGAGSVVLTRSRGQLKA